MNLDFLDFEQPIAELEEKIESLKDIKDPKVDIESELNQLKTKNKELIEKTFSSLTDWQISQLSRHTKRLHTSDYIDYVFDDFIELHGDRAYADDTAIIGGLAKLNNIPIMFIGQEKGLSTSDKVKRNFGMPRPEGYRKALRLMTKAEKFDLPIITFIDTPGAYPGIGAEERGQSESIAKNLYEMAGFKVPIISVVIGEGGSGGALALGVANTVMMLKYSIYSVISPEGCASILYKDAKKAQLAAKSLKLTSSDLLELGLIDRIIDEPLGGVHRDPEQAKSLLKSALIEELNNLITKSQVELVKERQDKFLNFGKFKI